MYISLSYGKSGNFYINNTVVYFAQFCVFRPFFGRPLQVIVRPLLYGTVVLSVCITLVCCNQTVGWIKMPLGTEVGIGPVDIMVDGDPAPPWKGAQQPPTFRPMSILWPNGRSSQQLLSSCIKNTCRFNGQFPLRSSVNTAVRLMCATLFEM